MTKKIVAFAFLAIFGTSAVILSGCSAGDSATQNTIDSLQAMLDENKSLNEKMFSQMDELGALLDSIERQEGLMKLSLDRGTSFDDHAERVRNIQEYIEDTKAKITKLEKQLAKAGQQNSLYAKRIKEMEERLAQREAEVQTLTQAVEKYREENAALIKTVDLQTKELLDKDAEIQRKRNELADTEKRLVKLQEEAKLEQANAFFARAETYEEMAQRTKLAPNKKKETYQQAYDMYKKAFEMGKQEAFNRMEALKDKL